MGVARFWDACSLFVQIMYFVSFAWYLLFQLWSPGRSYLPARAVMMAAGVGDVGYPYTMDV